MLEPYFIQPNVQSLDQLGLNYKDLLVYAVLRSHMNSNTQTAYPSIRRLSKLSGLSLAPLQLALKRLDQSGLITIHKKGPKQNNVYSFSPTVRFKMIPKMVLENDKITTEEKAVLIGIRQFFNDDTLSTAYSVTHMSQMLNVNYFTLQKHIKELKSKGYINNELRYSVEVIDGKKVATEKLHLTLSQDEINWRLRKVEERLSEVEYKDEIRDRILIEVMRKLNIDPATLLDPVQSNDLLIG